MNFMLDNLASDRYFRNFNVLDDYNRERLGIEVDKSLPTLRVISALDQIIEWRGKPRAIRCDNGSSMLTSNHIYEPPVFNGLTCICLNRFNMLRKPPPNGFGGTTKNGVT